MTAASLAPASVWSRLALSRRGVIAAASFCVMLTAGFAAMSAWQCGGVCLPEVAGNAVLSFAAGVLGLAPVAAYGGRR